jgi:hypothetical protein
MTTMIDGALVRHNFRNRELAERLEQISNARAATARHANALADAIARKDAEGEVIHRNWLSHSYDARLCAAVSALSKMSRGLHGFCRPLSYEGSGALLDHCFAIASSLTFDRPFVEPVSVSLAIGDEEDPWYSQDVGLALKAGREMADRILRAYRTERDFQFTGRGIKEAIRSTKANLHHEFTHISVFSISYFFECIDTDALCDALPLERAMTKHALGNDGLNMQIAQDSVDVDLHLSRARAGIAREGNCSKVAASICMSRIPWQPMPGVKLINHGEHFLLMATSAETLMEASMSLKPVLTSLPLRELKFTQTDRCHASEGFSFLGHELRIENNRVTTKPSDNVFDESEPEAYLDYIDQTVFDEESARKKLLQGGESAVEFQQLAIWHLANAISYFDGWLREFGESDDLYPEILTQLVEMERRCDWLGVSPADVAKAVGPLFKYEPSDYALHSQFALSYSDQKRHPTKLSELWALA